MVKLKFLLIELCILLSIVVGQTEKTECDEIEEYLDGIEGLDSANCEINENGKMTQL